VAILCFRTDQIAVGMAASCGIVLAHITCDFMMTTNRGRQQSSWDILVRLEPDMDNITPN
jgi:hypothetical protein